MSTPKQHINTMYRETAPRRDITVISINREIAELQATLFRLDPTPERLTAWADTYAMLPDGDTP